MHETPPKTNRNNRGGRAVAGTLLTIAAVASLGVGGVATWANAKENDDGYITADRERFSSPKAAVVSHDRDVDLEGFHWFADRVGNVRLEVESASSKDVFVGVARTHEVERYLRGVGHSTVSELDYGPFRVEYAEHEGRRRARPPAKSHIWAASATGRGTQTVDWNVREGDWSIVVMNADGSRDVQADIAAGVEVPWLDEMAWGTVGGGIAGLAGGIALLTRGRRGGRRAESGPAAPEPTPSAA